MEKENREWLEERGIQDIDDKELKLKFNQRFMSLIKQVKRYKEEKQDPSHTNIQTVVKELYHVVEEIIRSAGVSQGDFENIAKQGEIPLAEFPALLTREEEQYLKGVMKNMQ
ncbi:MerR family transcriptional regulator [Bacillus cereus]|uniref:MerR family transcriptional regulator n=1 Tax=Bacillus cereus TaxID=1396 RepID=UPI00196A52F6|nr:MerR family transcriptional regulator [Bacillus cereus]